MNKKPVKKGNNTKKPTPPAAKAQMPQNPRPGSVPKKTAKPKKKLTLFGKKAPPKRTNNPPRQQKPQNPQTPQNPPQRPAQKPVQPINNQVRKPAQKPTQKPAQKPTAPINKKSQAAVTSAMRARRQTPKKHKFRGGNYILYYMMAGAVALVVLVILANTVLFDCKEITVDGNVRYTAEEIIEHSGLQTGDNLLHVDSSRAEESLVNTLAYIDAAKVKKSFPTKLAITVTEAEKWYIVTQNGVNAAVSRGGKIIEHCQPDKLAVVRGYEAETMEVGSRLKSKTDGKTELPSEIFKAAEKSGLKNINEIDITDRFSIKMNIENRIFLELGTISKIESKLIVAKELIDSEIAPSESVTILLSNPEQVAVSPINPAEPEPEPEPEEPEDTDPESASQSE